MALFKRGRIWWMSFVKNGRQYRVSTKTTDKKKAEMIYHKLMLELDSCSASFEQEPRESSITFKEFFENHYLKWCYKRQNYYSRKQYFTKSLPEWFLKLKLNQITTKQVDELQTYFLSREFKIATVNRYLSIVKAAMTKASEWDMITEERLKSIRKIKPLKGEVKRLRYLSTDEIQSLLNACDKHLYPIVFTALNTGMRKGEILSLRWNQIDLKNGLILLENDTKNKERREIPMNDALKNIFIQLFTKRRLDTEYVFVNPETGIRFANVKRSFNTAVKKAGIRDFHFHDLRHTFASQLIMSGADLKTVQELLGHKDIRQTLRYSHLSQAHRKQAVKALENLIYHNSITILSQ